MSNDKGKIIAVKGLTSLISSGQGSPAPPSGLSRELTSSAPADSWLWMYNSAVPWLFSAFGALSVVIRGSCPPSTYRMDTVCVCGDGQSLANQDLSPGFLQQEKKSLWLPWLWVDNYTPKSPLAMGCIGMQPLQFKALITLVTKTMQTNKAII